MILQIVDVVMILNIIQINNFKLHFTGHIDALFTNIILTFSEQRFSEQISLFMFVEKKNLKISKFQFMNETYLDHMSHSYVRYVA